MSHRISAVAHSSLLLCLAIAIALPMQAQNYKFSTLYTFPGTTLNHPTSLIIDDAGNLYGSSYYGGANNQGMVFKVTPAGKGTVLYNFPSDSSFGPINPNDVVRDGKGNIFGGTPYVRGEYDNPGAVFELTAGTYAFSTVYTNYNGGPQDLALDSAGNLYGIMCYYGNYNCSYPSLFAIPAGGQWTDLWDFSGDFAFNPSNLIVDNGRIYGANGGDTQQGDAGYVFDFSPQAGLKILHQFDVNDGSYPNGLAQDAAGNLYGTTYQGGAKGAGTIFKISPSTGFSTLYTFCAATKCTGGSNPTGSLLVDSKGNIFGTTASGVFELPAGGVEGLIYNAGQPLLSPVLAMDTAGNLYGITANGSRESMFKLTPVK
ncbi:MAG TPA: choice-of-anchor tandem repeat GloVer-containing protein [Candidatus Sulfotelmatobacter sp.]|jgi:uncharacterized repeat protein (TIGR03803 family)